MSLRLGAESSTVGAAQQGPKAKLGRHDDVRVECAELGKRVERDVDVGRIGEARRMTPRPSNRSWCAGHGLLSAPALGCQLRLPSTGVDTSTVNLARRRASAS